MVFSIENGFVIDQQRSASYEEGMEGFDPDRNWAICIGVLRLRVSAKHEHCFNQPKYGYAGSHAR